MGLGHQVERRERDLILENFVAHRSARTLPQTAAVTIPLTFPRAIIGYFLPFFSFVSVYGP